MTQKNKIIQGDCLEELKDLESESVDCCITSPPYWGLRDYNTIKWEGGDQNCDHIRTLNKHGGQRADRSQEGYKKYYQNICKKCGAKRIDKQLGQEKTPDEYVENMVKVFREVKRVLKKEGTCWLNLGDTYGGSGNGSWNCDNPEAWGKQYYKGVSPKEYLSPPRRNSGIKPKDLTGIPWRVAFALQADGWYLRQDIIWSKPNPMPESVTDRCTKSHEYVFLMSKNKKYYYEQIKEPLTENSDMAYRRKLRCGRKYGVKRPYQDNQPLSYASTKADKNATHKNKRSVWTITTKPFKEAHFATFPEALIEPMMLAGCPKEVCKKCGKAREPIIERKRKKRTDCGCSAEFEPGIVLDPFFGAGTTGVVAIKQNKNYIGIELSPEYIKIAEKRLKAVEKEINSRLL